MRLSLCALLISLPLVSVVGEEHEGAFEIFLPPEIK